jgi:hypothetical protein
VQRRELVINLGTAKALSRADDKAFELRAAPAAQCASLETSMWSD